MADVNVLDLTLATPGSNDNMILFDKDTGVAKSTRFDTLKTEVLNSKFKDTTPAEGDVYRYDATAGEWKNSSQMQTLANKANDKVLYLTSVACSALTGNFATVSNTAITADHVLAECVFANPSAITTDVTWTTGAGILTLNGTCASATTVNIVLVKKDN